MVGGFGKRAQNPASCTLSTKRDLKQLELSVVSKVAVQAEDKGEHGSHVIQRQVIKLKSSFVLKVFSTSSLMEGHVHLLKYLQK